MRLTPPSRGRPQAGFAHLRPPLTSNVMRLYRAATLSLCTLLLSGCASPIREALVPAMPALLAKNSHPLVGDPPDCGCWVYAYDSKMSDDEVLVSLTANVCRLRVAGAVVNLEQNARMTNGDETQMIFGSGEHSVRLWLKEVKFESECSLHSDPPTHGSCFRGKLSVQHGGQSSSLPIKVLCGC
jgi:hypothetical protein